jgi:hypothetical protein
MSRQASQTALLGGAVLLLVAVFAVLLWPDAGSGPGLDPGSAIVAPQARGVLDPGDAAPEVVRLTRDEQRADPLPTGDGSKVTTVLYPVELSLELVRPADLPDVESGPQIGSGRDARLKGRITRGIAASSDGFARIEFVEGTNAGRVLTTGNDGGFGAIDLYPGRNIVQVSGPGLVGARREVVLFPGKERLLNLSFGRLGGVHGRVQSEAGDDVVGARVNLDGQTTLTDEKGRFFLADVAPGMALLEIRHADYAPLRTELGVTHAYTIEPGKLDYSLKRPATLRLSLLNDLGGPEPALVTILPEEPGMQDEHPWYAFNPIELGSDGAVVEGLPPGRVRLRAYRRGARARPAEQIVNLNPGDNNAVSFELEPAPILRGRVLRDGQIVSGATVTLTAADPVQATLRHLRSDRSTFSRSILPMPAPARQQVRTDDAGRFVLEDWSSIAPWRLLEAISPEGTHEAAISVGPGDSEVTIELRSVEERRGRLRVDFTRRTQALPVEVTINGKPWAESVLAVGEGLDLEGLTEGTWKISASFYGNRFFEEYEVPVGGDSRLQIVPPLEAIEGQDRETWRRAGRPYPVND